MTHRQARRKLGSRSNRRRNTNGKNVAGAPLGKGGRIAIKHRFPHQASRKIAVAVARLVRTGE